ncbi:MAG TPA: hypothetical protein VHE30_23445 [Polyangiaceae bacterium]|nr:hypothetical protein [Polyangiaceae bacterium]
MIQPIVTRTAKYEALTDGSILEIRRPNGVIVGEGRLDVSDGGFHVDDYTGEVDEDVHDAVEELILRHGTDIALLRVARQHRGPLS